MLPHAELECSFERLPFAKQLVTLKGEGKICLGQYRDTGIKILLHEAHPQGDPVALMGVIHKINSLQLHCLETDHL